MCEAHVVWLSDGLVRFGSVLDNYKVAMRWV